jgi:Tfp pilus assembly protein PilF
MFNMMGRAIKAQWENEKAQWKNDMGVVSLNKGDLSAAMESFQKALRLPRKTTLIP